MSDIVTFLRPQGSGYHGGLPALTGWTNNPSGTANQFWENINDSVFSPDDTGYIIGNSVSASNSIAISGSIVNPYLQIEYAECRIRANTNNISSSFSIVLINSDGLTLANNSAPNSIGSLSGTSFFNNFICPLRVIFSGGTDWSDINFWSVGFSSPFNLNISAMEIYISGTPGIATSNSIPFWTAAGYAFSGINLYTASANIAQTGINLYSAGLGVAASSINLYTLGPSGANNLLNLYLLGNLNSSGSVNLYAQGPQGATQSLPLYTAGPVLNSGTSSLNFYTWSTTTPSIFNTVGLYTKSDGINRSVPLYTKGPEFGTVNGAVALYTSAAVKSLDSSINLFCENIGADGSIQLYTQGRGIEEHDPNLPGGGTSIGNSVPLYIGGNGVGGSINFYLGNSETSSGINFYTAGVNSMNGSINLAIPSVLDNSTNSINFHSHGF